MSERLTPDDLANRDLSLADRMAALIQLGEQRTPSDAVLQRLADTLTEVAPA